VLHGLVSRGRRGPPRGACHDAAPNGDAPPAPGQTRAPRRPRAVPPPASPPGAPPRGLLTRLFRLQRRPVATRGRYRDLANFTFTPETCPGLGAEACAFFNTPIAQCDPALLPPMLMAFSEFIAATMTPRDGLQDAQDVFSLLTGRLAAVLAEVPGDTPAAAEMAEPAVSQHAAFPQHHDAAGEPVIAAPVITAPIIAAPIIAAPVIAAPVIAAPDIAAEARAGATRPAPQAGGFATSRDAQASGRRDSRTMFREPRRRPWRDHPNRGMARESCNGNCFRGASTLPQPPRFSGYAACAGPPAPGTRQPGARLSRDRHGATARRSRHTDSCRAAPRLPVRARRGSDAANPVELRADGTAAAARRVIPAARHADRPARHRSAGTKGRRQARPPYPTATRPPCAGAGVTPAPAAAIRCSRRACSRTRRASASGPRPAPPR
jgi:hypothetical protein